MRSLPLIALMVATNGFAAVSKAYIDEAIQAAAAKEKVPAVLLKAICTTESDLRADTYVYGDGGSDNHAIGVCQVLVNTAEEIMGKKFAKCRKDFRKGTGLARNYQNCELFGPKTNALVAAKVLKSKIERYGDLQSATAAYNTGSIKTCSKSGWVTHCGKKLYRCIPGDVLNRRYINRVDAHMGVFTYETVAEQLMCTN